MAVREVPTKTVGERYDCDECGEEMKPNGLMTARYPPKYEHRCPNNHYRYLDDTYPRHRVVLSP